MSGATETLRRVLADLAREPGEKAAVEPRHARLLLVALGQAAVEDGPELPEELLGAAVDRIAARRAAWEAAIGRDLELAVWEFDTSIDPRYLDRQDYDHAYTREARERIEARLVALDLLDLEWPEALGAALADADARYAPFADR